jgi:hypothetical protein
MAISDEPPNFQHFQTRYATAFEKASRRIALIVAPLESVQYLAVRRTDEQYKAHKPVIGLGELRIISSGTKHRSTDRNLRQRNLKNVRHARLIKSPAYQKAEVMGCVSLPMSPTACCTVANYFSDIQF